ncbi:MAG: YMGG-like glycine zipper-containing protein [Candidatus Omnitrophota bacterium]|nr:hypothetical protein [Candidatus Omnitrophota bacterium]
MKRVSSFLVCLIWFFSITGCQNTKTRAVEGAVIGGILGAGAGYGIGHGGHHGGEGAAIGAAAGALTGAFVGSQIDKPQSEQSQGASAANPNQMSVQQVIDLSKQGVHEDVIVDRIRLSNSKFALSPTDVTSLEQQGVSQKVIAVMQGV